MVELSGKKKSILRATLKIRPVDIKVGKRGLTHEFIRECTQILTKDNMIKLGLPAGKDLQLRIIDDFSRETSTWCVAKIGKTAAFSITSDE